MNRGRDAGQSSVEFALVLPAVVLLIAGVVQVGRLVGVQVALVDAARAGARAASVDPRAAVAEAAVRRVLPSSANVDVRTSIEPGRPRLVTVEVIERVRPLGRVAGTERATVVLRASATAAVEERGP